MNLYLDDDCAKGTLVARLRKAGHQVEVPADASLTSAADPSHFLYAVENKFVLVTKNHDDFRVLHLLIQATRGQHTGIFAIRCDNDPTRDMKDADVIRAIRNLEQSGVAIANELHILNHWR